MLIISIDPRFAPIGELIDNPKPLELADVTHQSFDVARGVLFHTIMLSESCRNTSQQKPFYTRPAWAIGYTRVFAENSQQLCKPVGQYGIPAIKNRDFAEKLVSFHLAYLAGMNEEDAELAQTLLSQGYLKYAFLSTSQVLVSESAINRLGQFDIALFNAVVYRKA
jgi:hypothetical protein